MDHGGVALAGFFVTCGDVTELFKIAEEVFDEMAQFVHVTIAGNLAGTVGPWREDGAGAAPIECDAQPIIVEGPVAEQSVECDSSINGSTPTLSWRWPSGGRAARQNSKVRIPKPEWVGKIAPGCTRAGDPEHGFPEEPVIGYWPSGSPGWPGRRGQPRLSDVHI